VVTDNGNHSSIINNIFNQLYKRNNRSRKHREIPAEWTIN